MNVYVRLRNQSTNQSINQAIIKHILTAHNNIRTTENQWLKATLPNIDIVQLRQNKIHMLGSP